MNAIEEPAWLSDERDQSVVALVTEPDEPSSVSTRPNGRPDALEQLEQATIDTEALKALPPGEPLVDGLLSRDSLALMYGPSGEGKSFAAVDLALSVAYGAAWHGRTVHAGPVIYVCAEGARGLGRRVAAWQQHHRLYGPPAHPVWWVTRPVHLFDAAWANAFEELCAARDPVLVVLDTLARCALGADENSAKDMGQLIEAADRVRRRTGATMLPAHHAGKDRSSGARGSSALRAAVDTEIEVTATDDEMTVRVTKQKDGAAIAPIRLTRSPVGDSCVLIERHGRSETGQLAASAVTVLEALRRIEVPGGIATSVWLAAAEVAERTFYDARKRLIDAGLVHNLGTDRQPRYMTVDRIEEEAQ